MDNHINREQCFDDQELVRISELNKYENELYEQGYKFIAGIDEAGRGPLAGPVLACALILPRNCFIHKIDDSKKLSAKKRDELFNVICENAIEISYGMADTKIIDEINILQATWLAMRKALEGLSNPVDISLIDGLPVPGITPQKSIIGGDRKSISIAAASIMAKVTRDRLMIEYDEKFPEYGFGKHKGYGTKEHMSAIAKYGVCEIHRLSFAPCKQQ